MGNSSDDMFFGAEGEAPVASPNAIARLQESMGLASKTELEIEDLENELKVKKAILHELRTKTMPDLMAELQTTRFVYGNNEFELADFVSGSLPKDPNKREVALDKLREYGAEGLITSDLELHFPKSQEEQAQNLYYELSNRGLTVKLDSGVHTQTYQAWARQRLKDGDPIDAEALGLFIGKVVKIKPVKEKRK